MSNSNINIKTYQIGSKIKKAREEAKLTQAELGELIGGYSAMAISYFENGDREVKIDLLSKIADALSKNLGYFLNDETSSPDVHSPMGSAYFRRGTYDLSTEEKKEEDEAIKNFKDFIKNLKEK